MKARTQTEFAKRWVGGVTVKSGELKARFTSTDHVYENGEDTGKIKTFPNGEVTMDFKLKDLPKEAQKVIRPNMESKRFRLRLNEDADAVDGVTPWTGQFKAKLEKLGPKDQNGNYKLIEKVFNKGKDSENSHLEFLAIYKITEGVFKGVELPAFYLHYKFEMVPEGEEDEGMTQFNTVDSPKASQLHKLQAWAEVHGNILDEPIVWPDDGIILETLEERALEADRDVNLLFENGNIKSVQAVENYETDDEELPDFLKDVDGEDLDESDEVEEKKPAKKPAPKAKAKAKVAEADDSDDL